MNNSNLVACNIASPTLLGGGAAEQVNHDNAVQIPAEFISHKNNEEEQKIKTLLLATKAPDAVNAVNSIRHRLYSDSKIVILSNGALAIKDHLQEVLSSEADFILASTTHGAYRGNDITLSDYKSNKQSTPQIIHNVVHAGKGKTFIEDKNLAHLFHSSKLNCYYSDHDEINTILWKKLAANCVINPLTALHNIRNGEIRALSLEGYDNNIIIDGIIQEVSAVASAHSHNKKNFMGLDYANLSLFVNEVIHDTCDNKSSMLQDVLACRETEIDYLNGYIHSLGKIYNIETPFNYKMIQAIKERTKRSVD
eukprot:CAMPEP_0178973658 /NCGR_PEP_ID=MMETSP0789-20121207/21877_1 /TAXON_ID=3005 /ORGANISM="Rhizosolenia setigera, Strain CCMP 1694" /LENGTH=308 /DNA_ID=CAMNT_0020661613 /DNA_START=152 /DNA_END=1078 /DNA_ORIENTATION=-